MTRRRGIGEGVLVVAGAVLVPVALLGALRAPVGAGLVPLLDALVALAGASWALVVSSLALGVRASLRGASVADAGPIGWAAVRVAALVLLIAPFLSHDGASSRRPGGVTPSGAAAVQAMPGDAWAGALQLGGSAAVPHRSHDDPGRGPEEDPLSSPHEARRRRGGHRGVPSHSAVAPGLLAALAADLRRRRRSVDRVVLVDDTAIDAETDLLRSAPGSSPHLRSTLRMLAAAGVHAPVELVLGDDGIHRADGGALPAVGSPQREVRGLAVVLGTDDEGAHVLFIPRGSTLALDGSGAAALVADAVRVAPALGLGCTVTATPDDLLDALALRDDDELVVCVGAGAPRRLLDRAVEVHLDAPSGTMASVGADEVVLPDGRRLRRDALDAQVRRLCDGEADRPLPVEASTEDAAPTDEDCRADGVVVRLLAAVPRVDGLTEQLEPSRERRAVELLAYLALREGQPVTGERLRVRVLGTPSGDAAAKTLANVASSLRRSLGEGPLGPRLPAAGRVSRYAVSADVRCDVAILHARVARAASCADPEERIAWLRAALELIEGEPFATVLEGYDWFLTEGHLARLQTVCEEAACALAVLAIERGLVALARLALAQASLVEPHSERLAAMSMRVEAAAQASFDAMLPALRSTVPSAPTVR